MFFCFCCRAAWPPGWLLRRVFGWLVACRVAAGLAEVEAR